MAPKKLLKNSLSLFVNRLTQAIATFILSAAIARTLGAEALGQYLLAISYYYIFANIASQGLKTLFTREIACEPELTPVYLVNGTLLQIVFSLIAYVAMVIIVFLLPYSAEASSICYILGLTILPFTLSNITEAIFQAQEKMHLIVISTVPIYILRLLGIIWVIQLHYGITTVAEILVFSESLILVIQWLLLIKSVKPKWQINQEFIWNTIKAARTLFAIEGVGIVSSKIDVLILSLLGSELLLGIYSGVTQLMQPFSIISGSITLASFPAMSKSVHLGRDKQREVAEKTIELLLCLGLPMLIGILFLGKDLLLFIYQDPSFGQAGLILNIISLSLITSCFARTLSYLLIANGFERFNLIEVVVTSASGAVVGAILIPQYKLLGAALMWIAMSLANFFSLIYFVYNRMFSLHMWALMRRPLLISACMAIILGILTKIREDFLIILALAIGSYTIVISLFLVHQFGGFGSIWHKIFHKMQGEDL
ncbi:oligosaccharide flippase family protein [Merismopedia glauca]|uniref:Polysaccharide biosynthesis protein n=1 Tax=Merismopedia glauca CCAP 1448/3 TaxID=1296344 RepID=A0A2T1C1E1_9CYAN|nr:oligosaccharide flippase family protein [Merismopedia glauca]PSB02089.1 polysaccharide biosynthesis protein [Merismopedia glauca CCAP 1448/3]